MSRSFSKVLEPHRDLVLDPLEPQRGADVRAVQAAAMRRLEARGVHRRIVVDGVAGEQTIRALLLAGRLLGALEGTLDRHDAKGRPIVTVGVQRMVRHPGRRTPEQLARAEARLDALLRERHAREQRIPPGASPSGLLTGAQRREVLKRVGDGWELLLSHAPAVHYTQGPQRWQGIAERDRQRAGQFPNWCDCSSAATWVYWDALTAVLGGNVPDVVNGAAWAGGYTGTMLAHGATIDPDEAELGDAILYGIPGTTGKHVAVAQGNGRVWSHGSEGGPYDLELRYRGDVMGARRYL